VKKFDATFSNLVIAPRYELALCSVLICKVALTCWI